jgi:predicted NAD-dependent protein-ADP-ribosyltransferase YbiA (DUF1768 family)
VLGSPRREDRRAHRAQLLLGDGGDGSGKNMFGIILMEVREVLRESRMP